ncbi:CDP-alcohol phosphatidyltransferase family protein [Chryseolinea lacunae]|uniref:CDP-alcohol phosphatidyltransferase family protein n=1 Tax=Chryseolinea lacunae TaxID=2801331 RepID=A0ABS1KL60_9BACT|nr:CDP-alcohol phosphatidyltransferase family protein [Chryseolinea lacunae]MBL0739977.1 CDP-alcohol phosphatidyltransferase family protein [Chryseolinea lacunae]
MMTPDQDSRRPIASRDSGWAKQTAAFLAKQGLSPNVISVLSIAFALVSLVAFYLDYRGVGLHFVNMLLAVAGIQGRLIMNLLDGMVAVEHNKKSAVGGIFNEVPDRITDTLIIFGVGLLAKHMAYGMDLAYWAIALSIATAYIRTLGASLHCGHFFIGPMAKQHRMALITVGCVVGIWYGPVFYYLLMVMNVGLIITCYRRLAKIFIHLQKNAVS